MGTKSYIKLNPAQASALYFYMKYRNPSSDGWMLEHEDGKPYIVLSEINSVRRSKTLRINEDGSVEAVGVMV